ncbi:MAG: hypothetical protein LBL20_06635 [Treponema sp.]|jgi:hypothetical protein|nr:hypothetical protein [Treponema sp.]
MNIMLVFYRQKFHISARNSGASPAPPGTGLYACIFFACGKKGYRFYPLRARFTHFMPGIGFTLLFLPEFGQFLRAASPLRLQKESTTAVIILA